MGRLLAELFTQTGKSRRSFRPDRFAEREEDLEIPSRKNFRWARRFFVMLPS